MVNEEIIKECRKLTVGVMRERCLKRDNFTCIKCGSRENIDVHHKRYRIPPRLNDLITLCRGCHKLFFSVRKLSSPICVKCNSAQTYIRFSTNERICRACGNIQKIEEKKDEK